MHRIDGAGATQDNLFTEGNAQTGTPATTVTDDWLNDVQENLAAAIEGAGIALQKDNYNQLLLAIKALIAADLPAGIVAHIAATSAPTGWLKANGATISRTTYASLFAAIGTVFGAGDGATTFKLPDLRGEFVRGFDDGRGVDAGRTFAAPQADGVKAHTHALNYANSTGASLTYPCLTTTAAPLATATEPTGGTETRPRNIALLAIIKY